MFREDFKMLDNNIIYFDSGATTLKPKILSTVTDEYYNDYTANAHRGDYDNSLIVDSKYENVRELVKNFINAKSSKEIVFTNNATDSLNKIIFGYFANILKENDEVLITKSEHASNVLPWFELQEKIGIVVKYIELNNNHEVTLENVEAAISKNTKVIALAQVTNTIGDTRPIKEICALAHKNGILVLVDGAQSVPHMKVDVEDLDADFLVFSAHKMLGPTGVGVIYGKEKYLNDTRPIIFGGGMNAIFNYDGYREYENIPTKLEAGTPNIAGVIAFGEIINYINKIGIDEVHKHGLELKEYTLKNLKEIPEIKVYNENIKGNIVLFNYEDVFAQDLAIYLNKYNICVRAGNHCAKILKDEIGIKNTCRMSFYLYNTKEEIDTLVETLKNPNLKRDII